MRVDVVNENYLFVTSSLTWWALIKIRLFHSVIFCFLTNERTEVLSVLSIVGSKCSSMIGSFFENSLKSRRKCRTSLSQVDKAMYYASAELEAIIVCLFEVHVTGSPCIVMNVRVVDRRASFHPSQYASVYDVSGLVLTD